MPTLRDARLVVAWVGEEASFVEAAQALVASGLSAIAVLDAGQRVVGLFSENNLIAGLVPAYLRELRHTAFTVDDVDALARRGEEAAGEPVGRHQSRSITLELDTSATHAAERFLHGDCAAAAIVERERFVGMLSRAELARFLCERAGLR